MWIFNFTSTIYWQTVSSSWVLLVLLANVSWKNILTYFWALYSVPIIHLSVFFFFLPASYCWISLILYYSLKWKCNTSHFVLFSQNESVRESCSLMSDSLWFQGLYSLWNSPGQNTGEGSHSLLQGIFPIQGSNPGLLNCRQILYCLRHQGSLSMYRYKWSCFSTHSSLLFFIRTGILESWGSPGFSKIKIYSFSGPRSFYPLKLLSPNCFLSNRKSLKIVSYWWSPITFTVMCLYI